MLKRTVTGLMGVLVLGSLAVIWDAYRQLTRAWPIHSSVIHEIAPGSSLHAIARQFAAAGWISSRGGRYLVLWARATGAAPQIKAGEYVFESGANALSVLKVLTMGKSRLHQLTLIEGWTFDQALRAVWQHPAIHKTLAGKPPAEVMALLGYPDLHPEGRLLPETYQFPRNITDLAFLRRAFEAMQQEVATAWQSRDAALPYTRPDEMLTMASIIEKETGQAHERPQIAGVFLRRLRMGMRLQTDPTVIYGLGAGFDGNLRRRDLLADTPYNTYTRKGLPPTPICLPGRDSIQAALHPASGDSLYFVARGDGSHHFSATLDEHNAAVRRYQLKRR